MRIISLIIGFITLILGSIGIVVPFLPSTPFFLVSAFCFAKSFKRIDNWFKQTKIYKQYIEGLSNREGITLKAKVRILLTVTILFSIAAIFMHQSAIGIYVLYSVWMAHIIAFAFIVKEKKE